VPSAASGACFRAEIARRFGTAPGPGAWMGLPSSAASVEAPISFFVAIEARSTVLFQGATAGGTEPRRVRREVPHASSRRRCVAAGAVPFRVTAHAGDQVSFRFPGVMTSSPRAARPDGLWRVEAAAPRHRSEGARHRYSRPLVACHAEGLRSVAAPAARAFGARRHRVGKEPVAGVYRARPHATVVAIHAFALVVAGGARRAVCSGDVAMAFEPVRAVLRVAHPARWQELPARELRHQARPVLREVTHVAGAAGWKRASASLPRGGCSSRGGDAVCVALQTLSHFREVLRRCQRHALDAGMAPGTRDAERVVRPVIELQVRRRDDGPVDEVAVAGEVRRVAVAARLRGARSGLYVRWPRVVGAVASVASRRRGQ
jgi:hypothetical protein